MTVNSATWTAWNRRLPSVRRFSGISAGLEVCASRDAAALGRDTIFTHLPADRGLGTPLERVKHGHYRCPSHGWYRTSEHRAPVLELSDSSLRLKSHTIAHCGRYNPPRPCCKTSETGCIEIVCTCCSTVLAENILTPIDQ